MRKLLFAGIVMLISVMVAACATMQTNQEKGTAIGAGSGAAVGAILGQAIGRDTESTLIGAGIGAVVGGLTGNQVGRYMDLQEQELRDAVAASEAASIRREEDVLRATFKGGAYFDTDSDQLLPGARSELGRVSDILIKYPHTTIEVGGHTDVRGPEDYNQALSERRAERVRDELILNGVSAQRIMVVGYGESRPISSTHAANRRVEILIMPIRKG